MLLQGWTSGSACHEARGVEEVVRIEFILSLYLFPVPMAAAKSATLFLFSTFPSQSFCGALPFHYYIPDSPSTTLFYLSSHLMMMDGRRERLRSGEAVRRFAAGNGSEQQVKRIRGEDTHGCPRRSPNSDDPGAHTKKRMKTL